MTDYSGTVSDTTLVISGSDTATSVTVENGGILIGMEGGRATSTSVLAGGDQVVSDGGSATFTTVNSGGYETVSAGGTAVSTTINGSGMEYVCSLGLASFSVIRSGGLEIVFGGQDCFATIMNGGRVAVVGGGTAGYTTVSSGGHLAVLSGGTANYTALSSGGRLAAALGGIANDTIVNFGGRLGVVSGGIANSTMVKSGGMEIVISGGTASDTRLLGGGMEYVSYGGVASATVVESDGLESVASAGTAVSTTVSNGGTEIVLAGGVASDTTVSSGSRGVVSSGGTDTDPDVVSAGVLEVRSGAIVSGATVSGTIDFRDVAYTTGGSVRVNSATHLLTLTEGSESQSIGVDPAEDFSGTAWIITADGDGGTDIAPCFAGGTLIATERGDVAVEDLRIGDRVASAFGGRVAVKWLGHRHVDCRSHPKPHDVWPVRIAAGAFAPNQPIRNLRLSPDHAAYVEGVLIPVRYLLNDATIRQEPAETVTYWHVELPAHDVLFAEGMPAESYLDTGNRGAFANGGAAVMLHPDFALRVWKAESCAPLVVEGAILRGVREALLGRAEALGYLATRDAGLHLAVDGHRFRAIVEGQSYRFRLPRGAANVRLRSLSAVPAFMQAGSSDHRRLGVAVSRIALDGQAIPLGDARLGMGWQAVEAGWRWTDGDAALDATGARALGVELAITGRYWLGDEGARRSGADAGRWHDPMRNSG